MKLRLGLLAIIGAALVLSGCNRHFTRARFESIKEGADTQEDVRDILGKPKVKLTDQWIYDNHKKHYSAVIHFDPTGHVAAKEWIDARRADWEGANPSAEPPLPVETGERERKAQQMDKD